MGVGVADRGEARKRRDEDEERRPRQMEIRQQAIDDAEPVAGADEQGGLGGPRDERPLRRRGLQRRPCPGSGDSEARDEGDCAAPEQPMAEPSRVMSGTLPEDRGPGVGKPIDPVGEPT